MLYLEDNKPTDKTLSFNHILNGSNNNLHFHSSPLRMDDDLVHRIHPTFLWSNRLGSSYALWSLVSHLTQLEHHQSGMRVRSLGECCAPASINNHRLCGSAESPSKVLISNSTFTFSE
jgi:hypothetical protein